MRFLRAENNFEKDAKTEDFLLYRPVHLRERIFRMQVLVALESLIPEAFALKTVSPTILTVAYQVRLIESWFVFLQDSVKPKYHGETKRD